MYLLINPDGSRLWYLKYRFNSKESRIALGPYPQVSLSDARQQREGSVSSSPRNSTPLSDERMTHSPDKCFKAVALAWHKSNKKWSADYAARLLASMRNHIFPSIGHLPITTLKTQHFTMLLMVIEEKGFLEVASRSRQQLCNIMRYAVQHC